MRFAATTALILFGLANITSAGDSLRAAFLNLGKVETALLASICEAATLADENFLYAPAENKRADKVVQGVVEVSVMGLYTELAKRTVVDDHDASHALTMAILRGDKRAKEAKQQAFRDKLADSIIERMNNGHLEAKAELEALAAKGNDKARNYLCLNKPVAAAAEISGTASAAVTAAPAAVTPSAAPANVSPATKN